MQSNNAKLSFFGQLGSCGARRVFLGFAAADDLYRASFSDTLDEISGKGYQRRFNQAHSKEFSNYIHTEGATTIPLTFNLRPEKGWSVKEDAAGKNTELEIDLSSGSVMSQVDCQHRLGNLSQSKVNLPFMCFLGLTVEEEIEIFRTINGKAKGLSGSLIDYTEAQLIGENLRQINPSLFIALYLHEENSSPWFRKLDLGGERTIGLMRIASLRTMQNAMKKFFHA